MAGPFTEGNPIDHVASDGSGTVWPFAKVQVNVHGGGAASLFADVGQSVVLANPVTAGSDGAVRFFVAAGDYDFVATSEAGASKSVFVTVAQQVADVAVVQSSLTAQLAAYVPSLGVAGPPATAGTTVGQAEIDVNGLMWVWNGTQWQLGGVGLELGYAETTVNYVLTTSFVAVPGLMVTATVPPGVDIRVEAEFPWVVNGTTGNNNTGMWMSLFEDAVLIGTAIAQYPIASTNSGAGVRKTYTPSSTGPHTYSVKVQQGASSAGATLEAGSQFGGLWNSSLRVVTV